MVNKEFLTKWVAALRSGEFSQVQGQLGLSEDGTHGFCCLGVACEVAIEMGHYLQRDLEGDSLVYDGEEMTPPDSVRSLAGLSEWTVEVPTEKLYDYLEWDDPTKTMELAELNDSYGWTFSAIADALEDNYL